MINLFILSIVLSAYAASGAAFSGNSKVLLQVSTPRNPKPYFEHMGTVHVKFALSRGISPHAKDWIGLFCPGNSSSNDEWVAFEYTNGSVMGVVQFDKVVNMRCKFQFRYIQRKKTLGETEEFHMAGGDAEPVQIHLAATGTDTEMRVMWTSGDVRGPTVYYSLDAGKIHSVSALATATTYHASDMCHAPATTVNAKFWRHPGWMMQALMVNLLPGETYFYKVGGINRESNEWVYSDVKTFLMPKFSSNEKMSFFIFGDSGAMSPAVTTYNFIASDMNNEAMTTPHGSHYAALIHIGDISYAVGKGYIWEKFMSLIEPISSKLAYMVGIGNHEYCYISGGEKDPSGDQGPGGFRPPGSNYYFDSHGECAVPMVNRFQMPGNGNGLFWYSFNTGLVHHIMISSEHNFFIGSPMYAWLENDLKAVDRQKTPWVVLYSHRPLYCSEDYKSDYKMSLMLRKNLEELTYKYGVDAVFTGHYHSFERTCPVYKGHCLQNASSPEKAIAPVHFMVGAGGYDVDDAPYYNTPWSKFASMVNGYSRVHVHNRTHMHVELMGNKERKVIDSSWVISDHEWSNSKTLPKLYQLSTKEWPSSMAFINRETMAMRGEEIKLGSVGLNGQWFISERSEQPGTYLISTNEFQDYYLYMTIGGLVKASIGDPGEQGYWIASKRIVGYKKYVMLSSVKWPETYIYQVDKNSRIRGIKGDPGFKGYWFWSEILHYN